MAQTLEEPRQATSGPLKTSGSFLFRALSRLRRARIFHPSGHAFSAKVDFHGEAADWLPISHLVADDQGALARVSRGAGVPDLLPDILGLAVRVPAMAPGTGQDLLMATCGSSMFGRNVLKPARDFLDSDYSTILPFRVDERLVIVGARAARDQDLSPIRTIEEFALRVARGPVRFDLRAAELRGDWQRIGTISIEERLPDEVSERLRFNPWNTHPDLHPSGPLNGLREGAYPGSQRGRSGSLNEDRAF